MNSSGSTSKQLTVVFGTLSAVLWIVVVVSSILAKLDVDWWMAPAGAAVLTAPFAAAFTLFTIVTWIIYLNRK